MNNLKRKTCIEKDAIKLLYAENADRKLIYDMAFEEDAIWQSMFVDRSVFDWAEIRDEDKCFFGSEPGLSKYLLIQYRNTMIGVISHTYHNGKISNMELDMWLRSTKYTGEGIGPAAMKMLIDHLVKQYGVRTFIIRPWLKNPRAIKAYEKCGFRRREDFEPRDYYGKYLKQYGDGDYSKEETVNMVLEVL